MDMHLDINTADGGETAPLCQTYTEISEVLVVVQSVTHQKGIRNLKTNVWKQKAHL